MVPVPPLPEQRRIAGALRTIQDAIAAQDNIIAAAREFKRSLMERLFTYGPGRDPAPTKETEIGEIPEHWELVRLGDLARKKITDGVHKTPDYRDHGIPFITVTNLHGGDIDFANCKHISDEEHRHLVLRCKPERGDVLLSKVGTLGRTALINNDVEFSIFVQLALIKPRLERVVPVYLKAVLDSPAMQRQIVHRASRSTMMYIGVGKIAELVTPLPARGEQGGIADVPSSVDAKIAAEEQRKAALEELFRSTLEQLMTGQIRLNAETQSRI